MNTFIVPLIATAIISILIPNAVYAHTQAYWDGYKVGQEDGKTGIYDPGSCCPGYNELQVKHWIQGYNDGYKSICGNLNSRMNPPCSSPPT